MPLATPADVQAHASANKANKAEVAIVRVLNRERRRRGIPGLRLSPRLAGVARNHTLDQLRTDRLNHTSSDGTPSDVRIRRAVRARANGETIAFSSRGAGSGARTIVRMWLRSPAHASVLLSRSFRRVGIGRAKGRLGSSPGVVVTANLTSRR